MIRIYALLCCLLWALTLPAYAARMQEVAALTASLTIIPPAGVSSQGQVEIRLGLDNDTPELLGPLEATVQFYIDVVDPSMRVMLEPRTVVMAPESAVLVSTFWAPLSFQGPHTVIALVQRQGFPEMRLEGNLSVSTAMPDIPTVPLFTAAWLEPGALGFFWPGTLTKGDWHTLMGAYRARGISLLILAYPEFGGCYYYPAQTGLTFPDYSGCGLSASTYDYTCPGAPTIVTDATRCPWAASFDLFETILSEADQHGMQVMLGLGRSGDTMLSIALEDYYLLAADGIPNGIDARRLNSRLGQAVSMASALARDLWRQYRHHPSLYGWAISHELTCYDVAQNLYVPLARAIKQATMPDRPILVAPYAPRKCLPGSAPIPVLLQQSPVDIWMYQDAVGSSTGTARYGYEAAPRILELPLEYADIARWHAGTGKHVWASVEIWRAAPSWDQRESVTAPWRPDVALQMALAGGVAETVVLNEGLFYLDLGVAALQLPLLKQPSAMEFMQGYSTYRSGRGQ